LTLLICLMRGSRSNPSRRVTPKPTSDWPWVSTMLPPTSKLAPWCIAPSIMAATSEAEQLISWE